MTVGVIAFVVALLVSIMLHEAGHFLTAKAFRMKATQFFLGFGPTLFSFRRGETEYGVKAIPAGGFVKIVGMTPLEELDPADEPRAFWRQSAPKRAVVLAAGSTVHFAIGFIVIYAVLTVVGLPSISTTVDRVSPCVTQADPADCTASDPPSPAAAAGLRPGDRVVAFNGQPVDDWVEDLSTRIRETPPGPAELVVVRDGERVTLRPVLVQVERPGATPEDPPQRVSVIGVSPGDETVTLGPVEALGRTGDVVWQSVVLTFKALGAIPAAIPELIDSTFGDGGERDAAGLVGPVGAARVSGEAIESGSLVQFLTLVAGLNIFIGIFNLLPLLPLDGGHLAVLGFEKARSGLARLLRRPDPGRVDLTRLMPVAYVVILLFVGLSVLLLYADIVNPIANPFE